MPQNGTVRDFATVRAWQSKIDPAIQTSAKIHLRRVFGLRPNIDRDGKPSPHVGIMNPVATSDGVPVCPKHSAKARRAASARQQIQDQNFIAGYVACGGNNRGKAQIRATASAAAIMHARPSFTSEPRVLTTTPKPLTQPTNTMHYVEQPFGSVTIKPHKRTPAAKRADRQQRSPRSSA